MTPVATTSIAGAAWLADPRLLRLFAAIETDTDTAWVVGGAVRNTLLDRPVVDVDVATTTLPEVVTARALAAGLKPVPTGIDHGTVTVVVEGHPFEVTTLRRDVESHGRHATVAFGRDWEADARRRDFTLNALYASLDGVVHDFVGGIADCRAGRVRFIGDAAQRIAEDRLRILRFFRFHAAYGRGGLDPAGLAATIVARDGLAGLSAERIGQETLKLVVAVGAPATLATMSDVGLAQRLLGRAVDLAGFARLHALAAGFGGPVRDAATAPLFLAALAAWTEGDTVALAARLRLANAARDRMVVAVRLARQIAAPVDERHLRALLEAAGPGGTADGLALAAARGRIDGATALAALARAATTAVPVLPIGGRDLLAIGCPSGPAIGAVLAELAADWRASGHVLDHAALVERARAIVARQDGSPIDPKRGNSPNLP